MSLAPEPGPDQETFMKPEALLRVPVGLASPLWGLFAGAAMTGAAWWWMTRLAQPANLEAMFGAVAKAEAPVAPPVAPPEAPLAAESVAELVDPEPDEIAEPVLPTPAAIAEAIVEPSLPEPPVGGEAAPISPVVAAVEATPKPEPAPAPKARKAAGPKADPAD